MLKQRIAGDSPHGIGQPPSGGCVLKPHNGGNNQFLTLPAAFGRLCVETFFALSAFFGSAQPPSGGCVLKLRPGRHVPPFGRQPPSGGCVLKLPSLSTSNAACTQPPSGGCVLKQVVINKRGDVDGASRLRAAVC